MKTLIFIGIPVPEPVKGIVIKLKQELQLRFGIAHALKTEPHITLVSPFFILNEMIPELIRDLRNYNYPNPVLINYEGVNTFRKNRVVFADVKVSQELILLAQMLNLLAARFKADQGKYSSGKFHPHITLAHRDLNEDNFLTVHSFLKDHKLSGMFIADTIRIYHHQNGSWSSLLDIKL